MLFDQVIKSFSKIRLGKLYIKIYFGKKFFQISEAYVIDLKFK